MGGFRFHIVDLLLAAFKSDPSDDAGDGLLWAERRSADQGTSQPGGLMDDGSRRAEERIIIRKVIQHRPYLSAGNQSPNPLDCDTPVQQVLGVVLPHPAERARVEAGPDVADVSDSAR